MNYSVILENQKTYFYSEETKSISFRKKMLKTLKKLILDNEKDILAAVYADLKKPDFENQLTETQFTLWEIDYFLKYVSNLAKSKYVETPLFHKPGYSFIKPEPLGVSLIISPWNYPFQLLMAPLAANIAAGNCAFLKPSEISPNTSAILANLIPQYFNPDYIAIIEGGVAETTELLKLKFDHIFYTGSSQVGKIVMAAAAQNLCPVTLELGGKSPCVIDENVPLKQTARKIAWGKFLNAGQTCIAPDYILVHESIKKSFVEVLQTTITEFYGENPQNSSHYARIINQKHWQRLISYLKNAKIIFGGDSSEEHLFIAPTIVENPDLSSPLMMEEIFGPILPIITYTEIEEVAKFINDRPKPLAMYVFSKNKKNINYLISRTSSGGMCINDTLSHITSSELPFGGVGESGMGNYHGKAGFDTFSHYKSIMKKSFLLDFSMKYPPYMKLSPLMKKVIKWIS
ncbi:MAG: aldehyde dehydrogenase [Bacteroidales bacterium]|nr:aldehyde dehydrogenase [Bacteroidales bacterium]MDD4575646.1 aldehyde dehydrogenase [Bacteroidales bacterium]